MSEETPNGNGAKAINDKLSFWMRVKVPAPMVAILLLLGLISGDFIWDRVENYFGLKRPLTQSEIIVECIDRARKIDEVLMDDNTFRLVVNKVCSPPTLVVVEDTNS